MRRVLLQIQPGRETEDRGVLGIEHLLSALHPLDLRGLALVIAADKGRIQFLVKVPGDAVRLVESFLYAQYPSARCQRIGEVDDTVREPIERICYLRLRRPGLFPIKRHPQLVDATTKTAVDPLNVLLTALVTGAEHAGRATVEIQLDSLGDWYRTRATRGILKLSAREFPRAERWTDRYLRLQLLPRSLRILLRPLAAFYRGWIPLPQEAPVRAISIESAQSHDRESDLLACLSKVRRHLFKATVRLGVADALDDNAGKTSLAALAASFGQFDLPGLNGFLPTDRIASCCLSTEEVATLWHLPSLHVEGPHLDPVGNTILPPPRGVVAQDPARDVTILGESLYRNERKRVSLDTSQRRRHVWIVGKTGTGKTTLLENMLLADISSGRGVGLLDPHGDLCRALLGKIPNRRTNDIVVVDPSDESFPVSFNPLDVPRSKASFAADGIIATFMKLFATGDFASWGPRLEDIFRNTLLALLEAGDSTLIDVLRMLDDDDAFRNRVVGRIRDPLVRHWWKEEFPHLKANRREDPFASVNNKLRQLLTIPLIRNILAQPRNKLDLREAMDSGKIVLCNLAKGKLGERTSMFLGSLLMTRFQLDAMSRADKLERQRRDFYLYVDEFQNFATSSFAEVLSEARKYRLDLTLANQFLGQIPESLIHAILGNIGTVVSFAVGAEDAPILSEQMAGNLTPSDLVALPKFECYVRTDVEGHVSTPFSIQTLPPAVRDLDHKRAERVVRLSRQRYANPRAAVEAAIARSL